MPSTQQSLLQEEPPAPQLLGNAAGTVWASLLPDTLMGSTFPADAGPDPQASAAPQPAPCPSFPPSLSAPPHPHPRWQLAAGRALAAFAQHPLPRRAPVLQHSAFHPQPFTGDVLQAGFQLALLLPLPSLSWMESRGVLGLRTAARVHLHEQARGTSGGREPRPRHRLHSLA